MNTPLLPNETDRGEVAGLRPPLALFDAQHIYAGDTEVNRQFDEALQAI